MILLHVRIDFTHITASNHPMMTSQIRSTSGADPGFLCRGGLDAMASAEREPITGVLGQSPQRGPGAEPLVGGQGGEDP